MVKAVDKGAVITDVRVEAKSGGKSGDWSAAMSRDACAPRVVVASNRAAAGVYDDTTGPLIVECAAGCGFDGRRPGRRTRRRAGGRGHLGRGRRAAPASCSPPAAPG